MRRFLSCLKVLTGLPLSAYTAHEATQGVPEGLTVLNVTPAREGIAVGLTAIATGQTWLPMIMLAIDGAAVPTRSETGQSCRLGRKNAWAKRVRWTGEWREANGVQFDLMADEWIFQMLKLHQVQTD
jgi:hypothetical protein